jgi:hypothetical protein
MCGKYADYSPQKQQAPHNLRRIRPAFTATVKIEPRQRCIALSSFRGPLYLLQILLRLFGGLWRTAGLRVDLLSSAQNRAAEKRVYSGSHNYQTAINPAYFATTPGA